jgi:hypothetical protein
MLIDGGGRWEPEPEPDEPRRRRRPLPWRPVAWVLVLCWLFAVAGETSGLVSYGSLLACVTIAAVLVDRAVGRASWSAMREHRQ